MDKEELKENIAKIWNETERLRIANANGARDKDLDSFYRGRLSMYKELNEAGCIILDREKLKELPKTITNKQMAEAYGGYDFMTKDMRAVCRKEQKNMLKHFEDSIEEL